MLPFRKTAKAVNRKGSTFFARDTGEHLARSGAEKIDSFRGFRHLRLYSFFPIFLVFFRFLSVLSSIMRKLFADSVMLPKIDVGDPGS